MPIVLKTERLVLKKFSPADAQGFYELNLDPEVLRYTGDVPFASVAEAEAFILAGHAQVTRQLWEQQR